MVSSYVFIRKRTKRISLQRFLVTKMVLEMGKVSNYDILALYENQLWLERKCSTDFDFSRKFSQDLGELSRIMKKVNLRKDFSRQSLRLMRTEIQERLAGFLVPPRNFASFKVRFANSFQVRPSRSEGIPRKQIPPKRFVGKGYGDKGTLKNEARDGSPSWQTLSSAKSFEEIYEKGNEEEFKNCWRKGLERAKTLQDLENIMCNFFFGGLTGPIPSTWNGTFATPPNNPEAVKRSQTEDAVGRFYPPEDK